MRHSTDVEIRSALHAKKFQRDHVCPETLVIDELGLAHGRIRVDIAVFNGYLHGYEIKSSKDTLSRLPRQIEEYSRSLEKVSLVIAPNHLDDVIRLVPSWCGIIVAEKGVRGAIHFKTCRLARKNPGLELAEMSRLLWKREVVAKLSSLSVSGIDPKHTRSALYRCLVQVLSLAELKNLIKESFKTREDWRSGPLSSLGDGSSRLASK